MGGKSSHKYHECDIEEKGALLLHELLVYQCFIHQEFIWKTTNYLTDAPNCEVGSDQARSKYDRIIKENYSQAHE